LPYYICTLAVTQTNVLRAFSGMILEVHLIEQGTTMAYTSVPKSFNLGSSGNFW